MNNNAVTTTQTTATTEVRTTEKTTAQMTTEVRTTEKTTTEITKNVKTAKNVIIKTVVITGASSGIGAQLRENFVKAGHKVVCIMRTNPDNFEDFISCDLTDSAAVIFAAQQIKQIYGKVDILINNAGIGISGAMELLPEDKIRQVIELDYFAALLLTREMLPIMKKGGKIVNISSACALFALPFRSVYCSAKAAMNMFSFGLRMELSACGIDVVSICPGDILTPFTTSRLKYNQTNERYGNRVENAANKVDSRNDKRMSAIKSGKKIFKIANNKKGALYIIGAKYKVLNFFSRILPTGLYLKVTNALFGGK